METDIFLSCGHCWVFQIFWHVECSTFTASSFRIWNRTARIPSPPLVLFVVLLPKAHLTSHSRMSGCSWVTTPLWICRSLIPFCIVLLCFYLFNLLIVGCATLAIYLFISWSLRAFWSVLLCFYLFYLFILFVALCGLSLVAVSRVNSSLWCTGLSPWWLPLLRIMGSRCVSFRSCSMWAQ